MHNWKCNCCHNLTECVWLFTKGLIKQYTFAFYSAERNSSGSSHWEIARGWTTAHLYTSVKDQMLTTNNNNNNIIKMIITLFMSQVYFAEHRGPTNWWDRKSNQHKSNQIKCWFLVRGENRSTRGKTSWSWVTRTNKLKPVTYDVRSGNRTWATLVEGQCSYHCANTAP